MPYGYFFGTDRRMPALKPVTPEAVIAVPVLPFTNSRSGFRNGEFYEDALALIAKTSGLTYVPHWAPKYRAVPKLFTGLYLNEKKDAGSVMDHDDRFFFRKSMCLAHVTSPYRGAGGSPERMAAFWPRTVMLPSPIYFAGAYTYIMCRDGVSVTYNGQVMPFLGDNLQDAQETEADLDGIWQDFKDDR